MPASEDWEGRASRSARHGGRNAVMAGGTVSIVSTVRVLSIIVVVFLNCALLRTGRAELTLPASASCALYLLCALPER